jgi:hypothetical protein
MGARRQQHEGNREEKGGMGDEHRWVVLASFVADAKDMMPRLHVRKEQTGGRGGRGAQE